MKDKSTELDTPTGPADLFKQSQFAWLFSSNIAFFFAMQGQVVVRAWLAYKMTDSEFALGSVMFIIAFPMLLLGPIGGVIADRKNRRNVIIISQLTVFSIDSVILILLVTNHLAFWHLLCSAAIVGCTFPFIMPARHGIVVNVVGKLNLERAMAINIAGVHTARVLGPATAGFLIDVAGPANAWLMAVVLYGVGALLMVRVKSANPPPKDITASPAKSIVEGIQYIKDNRLILTLLMFGLLPMFLAMPFQNLLVVFAEKIWQVGSGGFGLLSASMGLGGITGAVWVASFSGTYNRLNRMIISMTGFGLLLFFFANSPSFILALGLVFTASICVTVFQTLNNTAIQLLIPDRIRGRISSFLMMSFSLPLLGTLPVAAIAEAIGAPLAVSISSALAVLIALVFYGSNKKLRNLDADVKRAMKEL